MGRVYGRTDDGILYTGRGSLQAVNLIAGSDAATAILYDGLTATGTKLAQLKVSTAANSEGISFPAGVDFDTGLYIDIGGTTPWFDAYVR